MGQKIALFRESTPTFNVMYVMLNFVPPLFYCMRQNRMLRVKSVNINRVSRRKGACFESSRLGKGSKISY